VGQKGFYRTNYSPAHWDYLAKVLQKLSKHDIIKTWLNKKGKRTTDDENQPFFDTRDPPVGGTAIKTPLKPVLHSVDRAGLLDDAFALGRAAVLDYNTVLNLTSYLGGEREYVAWVTALTGFNYMQERLFGSHVYGALEKYVLSLLTPALNELGALSRKEHSKATHLGKFTRSVLISAGLTYGHEPTRKELLRLFKIFRKHPLNGEANKYIHPDILAIVLRAGVESGSAKTWEWLWKLHSNPKLHFAHKGAVLGALTHTRSPWLLARLLAYTLDRTKLRGGQALSVIFQVAKNPIGMDLVWEFVQRNINKRHFAELPLSSIMVHGLSRMDTKQQYKQAKKFFGSLKRTKKTRSYRQMLELMRSNKRWSARNEAVVCRWLQERGFVDGIAC